MIIESWWTSSKEFGNRIPFATEATNSFEMNIPTISERKLGMTQDLPDPKNPEIHTPILLVGVLRLST